jgi:hypothetical protein
MVYLHWSLHTEIPGCLGFSVIRHDPGNDENMLIIRDARTVAEAYAGHVLDVYEHYRRRWKIQTPLPDKFAELKKKNPKAKAAEPWEKTMAAVGESTIGSGRTSSRPARGRIATFSTRISWLPKPTSGPRSREWVL